MSGSITRFNSESFGISAKIRDSKWRIWFSGAREIVWCFEFASDNPINSGRFDVDSGEMYESCKLCHREDISVGIVVFFYISIRECF